MTTVTKLDPAGKRVPSPEQAKKDAVGALVDSIAAKLTETTSACRKALDQCDETALAHAGRIRMELEIFLETSEAMTQDAAAMMERVEKIRLEHARLVNSRVET